jgi:hypothetical protein
LSKKLICTLLEIAKGTNVFSIKQLSETPYINLNELNLLVEKKLVSKKNGEFGINSFQKVSLALEAVKLGADLEKVCRLLSWQEFEQIIEVALNINGYATVKRQRFKDQNRRYEIDIIGVGGQVVLLIDCKHWKQSWKRSETKKAVQAQLRRAQAISKDRNIVALEKKLNQRIRGRVVFVPVIVTLSETPVKLHMGIPVVPVLKFGSFLNEMPGYLDMLQTVEVER